MAVISLFLCIFIVPRIDGNCMNHEGVKVDWWFIYRVPKKTSLDSHVFVSNTVDSKYAYYDSNSGESVKNLRVEGTQKVPITVKEKRRTKHERTQTSKIHKKRKTAYNKMETNEVSFEKNSRPIKKRRRNHKNSQEEEWKPESSQEETDYESDYRRRLSNLEVDVSNTLYDEKNPLYKTFAPFFENKSHWKGFAYSDDPPDAHSGDSTSAHAKGVLLENVQNKEVKEGFWLIHSLPNYPNLAASTYSYGTESKKDGDTTYGQTFLCVSLKNEEIDSAVQQIFAMQPNVYFIQAPQMPSIDYLDEFKKHFGINDTKQITDSCKVKQFEHIITPPQLTRFQSVFDFSKKTKFRHFAKSNAYHNDIFACLIKEMQIGFKFETWRRGTGTSQKAFCTKARCDRCGYSHDVLNVESVKLFVGNGYNDFIEWDKRQDHAKIGVSVEEARGGWYTGWRKKHFVCIGDTNRMYSQRKRGGGFMCIEDDNFWNVMNSALVLPDIVRCEEPY